MNKELIIGRKNEIADLERSYESNEFSLVLVKGRRRVGKTFLINHVFGDRFTFKFTGQHKKPVAKQLAKFAEKLSECSGSPHAFANWSEAFLALKKYLDGLPEERRLVIFFDELPWLDTPKSDFLSEFTDFLNDYATAKDNLLLIVCGSSSMWIEEKFTSDKGGLYNRHTEAISLLPFSLKETEEYLKSKGAFWSRYDIAICYMALGGTPYYLNKIDSRLTVSENLDRLFFGRNAKLADEFELLCETLFSRETLSRRILDLLVKENHGLNRDDIAKKCEVSDGGVLTEALRGLTGSGFVSESVYYLGTKKKNVYAICDYFMLFYLRFVKGNGINDPHFWRNSYDSPSRRTWAGLSFERLCKDHLESIRHALGISGVLSSFYSWRASPEADEGAQIDLVIDRQDKVVTLVEAKFYSEPFLIEKSYHAKLVHKVEAFRAALAPRRTVQLIFASTYGIKRNEYCDIVSKTVTLDDLFLI